MSTPRYSKCLLLGSMCAVVCASTASSTQKDSETSCSACVMRCRPLRGQPRTELPCDRSDLVPRGAEQSQRDEPERSATAERPGDRIQSARRETPPFGDRVNGLPEFRVELGFERVESAKVVKAGAVQSHPLQHEPKPQRRR